ncbi:RabGAP/TBC [Clavulina sp. PMI_390]|nr:RabGAP/TBC [Clavulina sp. PMI_390]
MADGVVRASLDDIKTAYNQIYDGTRSPASLRDSVASGHFYSPLFEQKYDISNGMLPGRSILWRFLLLFTTPLAATSPQLPLSTLRGTRESYVDMVKDHLRAPDGSFEEWVEIPGVDIETIAHQSSGDNVSRNNPLSLEADSGWNDWFAAVDLRKTIRQDVERTFPDIPYFRDTRVQSILTTILFLHANSNPRIGYRQGMHELLAPLLYAVDFDSLPSPAPTTSEASASSDAQLYELCSREWIAADAYALFEVIMSNIGTWYEWREDPAKTAAAGQHTTGRVEPLRPFVAPIVSTCQEINDQYLKNCDPALWSALQRSQIEAQIYGIRWLRLLFTREFPIYHAMNIWDGLFALDPTMQLSKWICVAMLIRVRNELIPADYSGQLTHLLRYPSHTPIITSPSISSSTLISTSLLLTQAQILQSSPNPASGATVAMQNRDALGIPMDIPEPEPPRSAGPRRTGASGSAFSVNEKDRRSQGSSQAYGTERRKSPQPNPGVSPYGIGNSLTSKLGSYADQYMAGRKDQFGTLPELFSRGLSDINGVVSNTVSEIRRNLPELQSRTSTPEIAFPVQHVSKTPEERPPWEPRTRFEIEKDINDMRALNKRLGKALGWAVDALLQSGDTPEIANAKREALESIAYVRDVLNTARAPKDLDEEHLLGEEELKRVRAERKAKEVKRKQEAAEKAAALAAAEAARLAETNPPPPLTPSPVVSGTSRPKQHTSTTPSISASVRPIGAHAKAASVASPLQGTNAAPVPFAATARAPPNVAPVAPWLSTPSSFSSNTAGASLRRPPMAAASMASNGPQSAPRRQASKSFSASLQPESSTEASKPQTYQSDPLRG